MFSQLGKIWFGLSPMKLAFFHTEEMPSPITERICNYYHRFIIALKNVVKSFDHIHYYCIIQLSILLGAVLGLGVIVFQVPTPKLYFPYLEPNLFWIREKSS